MDQWLRDRNGKPGEAMAAMLCAGFGMYSPDKCMGKLLMKTAPAIHLKILPALPSFLCCQ